MSILRSQFRADGTVRNRIKEARDGRYRVIGSIEGTIDAISARDEPYFCTVHTLLTGEAICCYFGPPLLPTVYANVKQRVSVRGTFTTRANDEVTSLRAVSIEPLDNAEIPTVDEMIGILHADRRGDGGLTAPPASDGSSEG